MRHLVVLVSSAVLLAGCASPNTTAGSYGASSYGFRGPYSSPPAYGSYGHYGPVDVSCADWSYRSRRCRSYSYYYYYNPYVPYGRSSMQLLISGSLPGSGEQFTGTAVQYADGRGTIELHSFTGSDCSGSFAYVRAQRAEGMLRCTDGRAGPFSFFTDGVTGMGQGSLNSRPFNFTFALN